MKVKCIDNSKTIELILNKTYEVLEEYEKTYLLMDENKKTGKYFKSRFEVIEDDECLDIDTDKLLEVALSEEVEEIKINEKVERKMTLKEKILAKINYKAIAEEVFDILEDEIVEEVAYDFSETSIAYDLVNGYKRDFIETAKEVIFENIAQEIDVDEVTDMLKEVAIDKADEI